jgi:hypothetical protein
MLERVGRLMKRKVGAGGSAGILDALREIC